MAGKRQFGNIRRLPSGRFQARFTAPDGVIVKAPTTFESKKRANDWLAIQHADLLSGRWHDPNLGAVTLSEYAEHWLEDKDDIEASTHSNYSDHLRRFVCGPYSAHDVSAVNPRLGDMELRHITDRHIREWHRWVREVSAAGAARRAGIPEGSTRWNRALRSWASARGFEIAATGRIPQAIRTAWQEAGCPGLPTARSNVDGGATQAAAVYRTLHGLFADAERAGRVLKNPCSLKGAGRVESPRRRPATREEWSRIIELFPDRYATAVIVAVWGGLRASEVFGLARRHIDFEGGSVHVERALKRTRNGVDTFGKPKTWAGRRQVLLPRHVMDALRTHIEAFTGPEPDALVFCTRNGRAVSSSQRTAMFRRAADAAERSDLAFHDLRHTGATMAAENGATTAQLMKRLGHASPRAAFIYQHVTDEGERLLVERMSKTT